MPHHRRGSRRCRVLGSLVGALQPQAEEGSSHDGAATTFRALVTRMEGKVGVAELTELASAPHPQPDDADITVRVRYSNINYKDGMVLGGMPGVAKAFPIVAGIDAAGEVVEAPANGRFAVGDKVCLTGGYAGQHFCGGFSQLARLRSADLVPLPPAFTLAESMAIGTAGFTAMQSIMHLEEAGNLESRKAEGPVLVTGAAGGVGSVAVALLSSLGYTVVASSGRADTLGERGLPCQIHVVYIPGRGVCILICHPSL